MRYQYEEEEGERKRWGSEGREEEEDGKDEKGRGREEWLAAVEEREKVATRDNDEDVRELIDEDCRVKDCLFNESSKIIRPTGART